MKVIVKPCNSLPTQIKLHQVSKILEIHYDDGSLFELPCEYLRVFTQSADAVGHGPGQEVLQTGKEEVAIVALEPVGNYAIRPTFSDGHDTGLYTWDLLYKLGSDYPCLWAGYLRKLEEAGYQRKQPLQN